MNSVTNDSFGPLVAYLLPGATALLGLFPYSPVLQHWFTTLPSDAPTIGGFVYLTLTSLAVGMAINAVRWAILDTIHAKTGLRLPTLDFSNLAGREQALALLIDIHYKHYQHHGSMLIATAIAYVGFRISTGFTWKGAPFDLAFILIEIIFFMMSRDCLRKYYRRSEQLLKPAVVSQGPRIAENPKL